MPKHMDLDGALGLYALGDKYLIHSVKWLAKRWVAGNLTRYRAMSILREAVTEEPGELEEMALAFLADNSEDSSIASELARLNLPLPYLFKMIQLQA